MNENKFNGKAANYTKARPNYPKALFDFLIRHNFINSNSACADIASGTGIFTAQIADIARKVYAVEPNEDMRKEAEQLFLSYSNIISVASTAENTTLKENSIDLVTAAQAFHWFDKTAFKKECQNILKPGGAVVLVWNDRNENADVIKANFDINGKYCSNFKGSSNGFNFDDARKFFSYELKEARFENIITYDKETFIARNLSSSYAPDARDDRYDDYIKELELLFERSSKNGFLEYPYTTICYIGKA